MAYDFSKFKKEVAGIEEWLKKEYGGIRTSRATPAILDTVLVESYGAKVPVKQIANITGEDARTIRVIPYDVSQSKDIEKAVVLANLGLSVAVDDRGVRVSFPELTAERRISLIKVAKEKLEHARASLRVLRDSTLKDIEAAEKKGGMGEDEKFRLKTELQKFTDAGNTAFADALQRKEKEITS
jgi:ribosome recycling factor